MAAADASTLGARIAEARARAGLTQAELAMAAALDRSALAKIEGGTRRVSALELARIADVLDERVEWFVSDPPPSVVSHRNLQEPGAPSPSIDRTAERVARNVEFAVRHDERWDVRTEVPLSRPGTADEVERSSLETRHRLGLDDAQPFLDISNRVAHVGLLAFTFDLGAEAADAASILLEQGGVAVVNGRLRVGRRRLALAHELGHYVFADEFAVDWRIAEQNDSGSWEARLDRFARAVLLPAVSLDRWWADLHREGDNVRVAAIKTASAYRVDMSTLARRLVEVGLVNQAEAREVRAVRTTKADIVEFNLLVHDELAPPSLARQYEQSVLRLYRGETISAARATDLLFDTWDETELPALAPLPADAIWKFV